MRLTTTVCRIARTFLDAPQRPPVTPSMSPINSIDAATGASGPVVGERPEGMCWHDSLGCRLELLALKAT